MSAPSTSAAAGPSPTLEPTLYALLSPSLYSSTAARASTLAIHSEPYHLVERIYTARNPVIPSGQLRGLRFRSRKLASTSTSTSNQAELQQNGREVGKGKQKQKQKEGGEWYHTLSYVSLPLRSAEFSQASVRAVVGVEVPGTSDQRETEDFIDVLGFQLSHTYTLKGDLFHIPLPVTTSQPITLHLSIARLQPTTSSDSTTTPAPADNPYIVRLHPSRPVNAVPHPGDIPLQDLITIMRGITTKFDALEWSTAGQ